MTKNCFIAAFVAISLVLGLGCFSTTTKESVDGVEREYKIPLWHKVVWFYLRDRDLKRWAEEAADRETDPQKQALKLMEWTRKRVKTLPQEVPSWLPKNPTDDHISYIVLRQYGKSNQLAEVFTTLATYLGNESKWQWARAPNGATNSFCLSFVNSQRGWMVLDVTNGGWFETNDGHIATIEDFDHPETLKQRGMVRQNLEGDDKVAYRAYFRDLNSVFLISESRAHGQIFWHRVLMELHLCRVFNCW